MTDSSMRLTAYASGGGCACKIPPGDLERLVGALAPTRPDSSDLLVGIENGDDAAAVRIDAGRAMLATADFFTPVVDDPYDWGRIAATNALSDIYAMGGTPVIALNLLAWPRESLDLSVAQEVLSGGSAVCSLAGVHLAGGHSVQDSEPKYGMAVSGLADPDDLFRIDAGSAGVPLTLTKPLGLGVLNNRHKVTGEVFAEAVEVMTTLNREAATVARVAGVTCATDVTGFGLLGHVYKMAKASGVTAVVDAKSVPYLDGARRSAREGFIPGGTRRNLDWVAPHLDAHGVSEEDLLLLADAQTSGGLLVAGELPGHPVIGQLIAKQDAPVRVVR